MFAICMLFVAYHLQYLVLYFIAIYPANIPIIGLMLYSDTNNLSLNETKDLKPVSLRHFHQMKYCIQYPSVKWLNIF